ncbi:MAG: hypothetical protein GX862_10460, partial [Leucobacter sp.]|nr:hypothetical protein [Leucobacter sp.]
MSFSSRASRAGRRQWGDAEPAAEPMRWQPEPSLAQQLVRAVSTPAVAGVTVFLAVVLTAVLIVFLRPHDPSAIATTAADDVAAATLLGVTEQTDAATDASHIDD